MLVSRTVGGFPDNRQFGAFLHFCEAVGPVSSSEYLISEREDQARDDKGDKNGGRSLPVNVPEQRPRPPFGITEYVNHQVGTATTTATSKRKSPGVTLRRPAPDSTGRPFPGLSRLCAATPAAIAGVIPPLWTTTFCDSRKFRLDLRYLQNDDARAR